MLDRKNKLMKTEKAAADSHRPALRHVVGIDFSGAALSGLTAWAAFADVLPPGNRLRLNDIRALGKLAADDSREAVNAYLVHRIGESTDTLWGMDFPFGLPIELGLGSWDQQLRYLSRYSGTAKDFGRHLVEVAQSLGRAMHVRRDTDRETQTPFDCYHYRIIYQTFHGMRDVLGLIARDQATCVLPFQYAKIDNAKRWVVEACPSSTLKRLKLPHRLYKQSAGKPPTPEQKRVRRTILLAISAPATGFIEITGPQIRTMLNDPGGDALDCVLAAVGSFHDFSTANHSSIAMHPRYSKEGRVYG